MTHLYRSAPESQEPALLLELKSQKTNNSVIFMKLKDLYPECMFLIEDLDQMFPLRCLRDGTCPRNQGCMNKLAHRINYVFDTFDSAQLLLLYFSYRDRPNSQRAGVFWRDMREPKYMVFNRSAWEKWKKIGKVYIWELPETLFLTNMEMRVPA